MLLVVGGAVLIHFEITLVNTFQQEFETTIAQTMGERKQSEEESLRKNVVFNTQLLSEISAQHLYDINPDAIAQPFRSYMNYPEIEAIQVLDDREESFAAIWRDAEIRLETALPEDFNVELSLSIHAEAVYKQQTMGQVIVYYTDAGLTEKLERAQANALTGVKTIDQRLRARLNQAIRYQSLGMVLIILALWACLLVLLRRFVLTPLTSISHIAHRLADFEMRIHGVTDNH